MDLTDTPDDVPGPNEEPPDFDALDDPETVLKGGPIRERLLDVVLQLREPTKVSTIADRADCDTETAREYLEWFTSMGIVREHAGRPVRYERNDSYLSWRRVERVRQEYTEREIVDELEDALAELGEFRDRYDAASPDELSLVELSQERLTEELWEELSAWKTVERRAKLLDAARRDESASGGTSGRVDA